MYVKILLFNLDFLLFWIEILLIASNLFNWDETTILICLAISTCMSSKFSKIFLQKQIHQLFGIKKIIEKFEENQSLVKVSPFEFWIALNNLQILLFNSYEEYCKNIYSPIIEKLVLNHQKSCYNDDCFCITQPNTDPLKGLLDFSKKSLFIYDFVRIIFQSLIRQAKKEGDHIQLMIVYGHFLLDVCENKAITYKEIYQMSLVSNQSLIDKMYITYLMHSYVNKYKINLAKSKELEDIFDTQSNEDQLGLTYFKCLNLKRKVLQIVNRDSIDINILQNVCLELLHKRRKLKKQIQKFKKYQYVTTQQVLSGYWQLNSMENNYSYNYLKEKSIDVEIKANEKDCILLMDIDEKNFGAIKKVSKQFFDIFGLDLQKEININMIIPPIFQQYHNQYIREYFQNIDKEYNNKKHIPVVLGQDSEGYSFPLNISFLLESYFSYNMSGLIIKIQRNQQINEFYLMYQYDTSKVISMSKQMHEKFFSDLKQNLLNEVYIDSAIPIISLLVETKIQKQEQYFNLSTIAFITSEYQPNSSLLQYDPKIIEEILKKPSSAIPIKCYEAEFSVYVGNKNKFKFVIINLIKYKKVPQERILLEMKELNKQINELQEETKAMRTILSFNNAFYQQRDIPVQQIQILNQEMSTNIFPNEILENKQKEGIINFLNFNKDKDNKNSNFYITTFQDDLRIPIITSRTSFLPNTEQEKLLNSPNNKEDFTLLQPIDLPSSEEIKINKVKFIDKKQKDQLKVKSLKFQKINTIQNFKNTQKITQKQQEEYAFQNLQQNEQINQSKQDPRKSAFEQLLKSRNQKEKKDIILKLLSNFIFLGMLAIIGISIFFYNQSNILFEKQKMGLEYISWPMAIRSLYSAEFYQTLYIKMMDQNLFNQLEQEKEQFRKYNVDKIYKMVTQTFDQEFYKLTISDKEEYPYFKNMTEFQFQYSSVKDSISYFNHTTTEYISYYYFLYIYQTSKVRYSILVYDAKTEEAFNNLNFMNYNNLLTEYLETIISSTIQNLDLIQANFNKIIYIITFISVMIISSSLTIILYLKKTIGNTLQLFATFNASQLNKMMEICELYLKNFYLFAKINNLEKCQDYFSQSIEFKDLEYKDRQQKSKSKGTSSTIQLSLFSYRIISYSFLTFALLITQPIATSVLVNSQIQECIININLMQSIYDMKGHITSNLYLNLGLVYQRLVTDNNFYQQDYFANSLPYFTQLNVEKLAFLNSVIEEELNKKRYRQDLYDNFFHKILNGNMCEALKNYPEFKGDEEFIFNYEECFSIRNQMLTKGFALSSTYLFSIIVQIYQILSDAQDFSQIGQFKQWEKDTLHLIEFDKFCEYLQNAVSVMKNFMIYISNDYISNMQQFQKYLLFVYCASILAILIIGWIQIKKYSENIVKKTNKFFGYFDQQTLLSNSYILKYFRYRK